MKHRNHIKLFAITVLIGCLVGTILLSEYVSASTFREPTADEVESMQQVSSPESVPISSEPSVEDLIQGVDRQSSFWERPYPWEVALTGSVFIGTIVFSFLFGVFQVVFRI